ncbi:ORF F58 [Sulfolobus virus Kamchatka 1]|uniref:ORF F58 n=1 Tax=Sulfolobus virus Kamchatka 1 TaxID=248496 RepID=Q6TDM8_9VIRU|nr:ORF F58 [Sulfolobus virus Kamchatka 1]AAQ94371.1 ORF F58 [Sulfolobus virus Kamchatka 1]
MCLHLRFSVAFPSFPLRYNPLLLLRLLILVYLDLYLPLLLHRDVKKDLLTFYLPLRCM